MEKVECEVNLVQKFIPQLRRAVPVDSGQTPNEVFLECGNGTFGSVDLVVVRRDKVNVYLVGFDVHFYHPWTFVVRNIEGGLVAAGCEGGKNFGEGGNHGSIVLGGHSRHTDGIEVVDVRHKYVLHGFEEVDGECAQEVGVHCACVEVGEGSKTKHVMGGADFFIWLEIVNIAPGLDDGLLHGLGGLNALAVAPHVALIVSW